MDNASAREARLPGRRTMIFDSRRRTPAWVADAGSAALAGLLATVFAWFALRLAPGDIAERWSFGGADQVLHYGIFTSATEVFPFVPNDALGYPVSQNLFFAPLLDPWSALFVRLLSATPLSGIEIYNLYNLLSFFAVGVTSYLFFRALGLGRTSGALWGVAFATLPHHFMQLAMGHPFIANYWAVPLVGIMVLLMPGDESRPLQRWIAGADSPRAVLRRRILLLGALSLLVGLSQSYYFVFGGIVLGGVWLFIGLSNIVQGRPWKVLIWPSATLGSLVLVVGIQLAILSLNFGDRYEKYFQNRTVAESEIYGGKLDLLLLPWEGTGIPVIGKLYSSYRAGSPLVPASEGPFSSLIAVIAIVLAMTMILMLLVTGGRWVSQSSPLRRFLAERQTNLLLFGFLWSLLFFVVSGLGPVFAFVVSPEIRAWSRMSIVVYLFAIAILALLADRLIGSSRPWRLAMGALLVAVVVADQGLGVGRVITVAPAADEDVRAFASELDMRLDSGCGIVQLPLKGFPESGAMGGMGDYDHFLPYLYSTSEFRWSYGAVRGTAAGDYWADVRGPSDLAELVGDACAVTVDTSAYAEKQDWQRWVSALGVDAESPDVESGDGRYLSFDLR
jgi:uncharacterized protein YhhL (DUF1145 family)